MLVLLIKIGYCKAVLLKSLVPSGAWPLRPGYYRHVVEAWVAKLWIPQTPDLEGQSSIIASGIVSLDKELFSTLFLFCPHMYKVGTADKLLGG